MMTASKVKKQMPALLDLFGECGFEDRAEHIPEYKVAAWRHVRRVHEQTGVGVMFFVGGYSPVPEDTTVVHWFCGFDFHQLGTELGRCFPQRNPYHRRKATGLAHTADLVRYLEPYLRGVASLDPEYVVRTENAVPSMEDCPE